MGLLNAVFADEAFDGEVAALAARLANGPTAAYAAAKRLMNESAGVDRLDHHLDRELDELARDRRRTRLRRRSRGLLQQARRPSFQGK